MRNLEGAICLISLPQADGKQKIRPVLLLKQFPPFSDYLVCGISTQIHLCVNGFDEIIDIHAPESNITGLRETSLVRLGFLAMVEKNKIPGCIGWISNDLRQTLLSRLADYLVNKEGGGL